MSSPTASEQLASFATRLRFDDLPIEVVRRTKELVLDLLGVSLAAYGMPASEAMRTVVRGLGGTPESTVLGSGERVPACNAALVNGTLAHGLDYDDTQLPAQAHMSASVVPAALASAEAVGADGKALIAACVVGWEVGLRVGAAAPGKLAAQGYHPTAICGAFASAAVAGVLRGLSADHLANALGIALSQAAGTSAYLDGAASTKKMHPGWAAHGGTIAALLAREGFTGPRTAFEGRFGLYNTHLPAKDFDLSALVGGLGTTWQMLRISMKPYPACHFNHACMDAALHLKERYAIDPHAVESVDCKIPKAAVHVVCEPYADKLTPHDGYAAKFSLPVSVALMLLRGRGGMTEFTDEAAHDGAVRTLASRITYSIDPEADFPVHYPGAVSIKLRDGSTYEHRIGIQRGAVERPLSEADVIAKFRDCVRGTLDDGQADALIERVLGLERQAQVGPIARLCVAGNAS